MKKALLALTILTIAFLLPSYSLAATSSNPHSDWQITVDGAVQTPLNLTIADLANMPQTTVYSPIYCYGAFVTDGNWTGVQLSYLLAQAGVESNVEFSVNFKASDGYTIKGFPMSAVTRGDVIIAYQKDGKPLDEFLRLVVPGVNGNVWVSMITEINVEATPGSSLQALTPPIPGYGASPAGIPGFQTGDSSSQSQQSAQESQPQQSQNTTAVTSPQPEQSQNQTAPEAANTQQSSPTQPQGLSTPAQGIPFGYVLIAVAVVVIAVGSSATYLMVKKKRTSSKP
jgi:DMSO/TMAO reductase YedYZ molybdopterin-dependent catalytic subunit